MNCQLGMINHLLGWSSKHCQPSPVNNVSKATVNHPYLMVAICSNGKFGDGEFYCFTNMSRLRRSQIQKYDAVQSIAKKKGTADVIVCFIFYPLYSKCPANAGSMLSMCEVLLVHYLFFQEQLFYALVCLYIHMTMMR